jgi:hypothetical protein
MVFWTDWLGRPGTLCGEFPAGDALAGASPAGIQVSRPYSALSRGVRPYRLALQTAASPPLGPRAPPENGAMIPDLASDYGHDYGRTGGECSATCPPLSPVIVSGRVNLTTPMIFLAVRMMSNSGHQLNIRDRLTMLSRPCGMPSPFLALDYRSWTGLGYAAYWYQGGGGSIAVTRHV